MKKFLLPALLLASCSPGGGQGEGSGNGSVSASAARKAGVSAPSSGPITTLVGLYEGGSSQLPHQMCVVDRKGEQRFGLIVWGTGDHNCAGSGTVTRSGDRLRLAMAGDSQCSIEATISGSTVKLPASVQEGCAYYCGKRASFGGAELTQRGKTKEDAMRAKDLVGDPLCQSEGG
jgi:hypothetical protein